MKSNWTNKSIFLPLGLILGFAAISYALIASPPQSSRITPKNIVPTVEVMDLKQASFDVTIQAQGIVKAAHKEITLTSQVAGKVSGVHPDFVPGGMIVAGENIAQIDQTDYQLALKEAQAKLSSALATMSLEQAQQEIASKEFASITAVTGVSNNRKALALRQPQLQQIQAELTIAQIEYDKAKIMLERTALTLPYDVLVLETTSAIGEVVSNGMSMAILVRAEKIWLELKVQQKHLERLKVKSDRQAGAKVTFLSNGIEYLGEVIGIRADVSSSTRMGGVIVEVYNQLLSKVNSTPNPVPSPMPRLTIGTHIEATLQAGVINNALKIPRKAITTNSQIYVVDEQNKLQLRNTTIQWQLSESLIIQPDLQLQDRLIVSRIAGILPGSFVDVVEPVAQNTETKPTF